MARSIQTNGNYHVFPISLCIANSMIVRSPSTRVPPTNTVPIFVPQALNSTDIAVVVVVAAAAAAAAAAAIAVDADVDGTATDAYADTWILFGAACLGGSVDRRTCLRS